MVIYLLIGIKVRKTERTGNQYNQVQHLSQDTKSVSNKITTKQIKTRANRSALLSDSYVLYGMND